MNIILIRHGESQGNKDKVIQGHICHGLSDLGKTQAELLGEFLKEKTLTAIYSSDLTRAIQTAEPTAKKQNLKISLDENLREACFGKWEGLTEEEVKIKYPDEYSAWSKDYFIRPHWFESFYNHQNRVKKALEKILAKENKDATVAVFTHGGSIKTQIGYFKKLTGADLTKFSQKNCNLAEISFNDKYENGELIYYNKQVINL